MKKYVVGIIAGVCTVVAYFLGGAFGAGNGHVGGVSQLPAVDYWIQTTATSSLNAVSSDVRLMATNTARKWLVITPAPSCGQGVYISLANDAVAVAGNSIFINASSTFDVTPNRHPYTGSIRALAPSGTCNINVTGE